MRESRAGSLAAAAAAVAFGTAVVATSFQLRSFEPVPAAMWRAILGSTGLTAIIAFRMRSGANTLPSVTAGALWRLATLGVLSGPVFLFGLNVAVSESGATITGLIVGLYAVFAAVIAPFLLKERLETSALVGLVLALAGTAFLASFEFVGGSPAGIFAGLFGALGYSLYLVLGRKWSGQYHLRSDLIALSAGLVTSVSFLLWLALVNRDAIWPHVLRTDSFVALLWLAGVMVGGQTLVMVSARLIQARRSAAFLLLNPLTAAVLGVVVLGETLTLFQTMGAVLVLVGMALGSGLPQLITSRSLARQETRTG